MYTVLYHDQGYSAISRTATSDSFGGKGTSVTSPSAAAGLSISTVNSVHSCRLSCQTAQPTSDCLGNPPAQVLYCHYRYW